MHKEDYDQIMNALQSSHAAITRTVPLSEQQTLLRIQAAIHVLRVLGHA